MSQLKQENGYYVWPKGFRAPLGHFFLTSEFQCLCTNVDCGEQRISVALVEKLEALRKDVCAPIIVTSAFRCRKHQLHLHASLKSGHTARHSTHELGHAADIKTGNMERLDAVLPLHFKAIGIAPRFRHVDLRSDKERRWKYV